MLDKKLNLITKKISTDYEELFSEVITNIKLEGRYREFSDIARISHKPQIAYDFKRNKEITLWCINDYLGMGVKENVIKAAIKATEEMGVGAGGTRNICGSHTKLKALENELASLHNKDSALVFTSGYVSNEASITALVKIIPDCVIFSDSENHASIIEGIKKSGAKKVIFKHHDLEDLEEKLKHVDINCPKLIIFESVYSMDGSISNIRALCDLADKYHAMTYVDEVHAVGLYGKTGGGISEVQDVRDRLTIIEGTLAKGFGTMGGYITGSKNLIDCIRSISSGFIFTTSLSPAIAAAATESIRYLKTHNLERVKLFENASKVKHLLKTSGIEFIDHGSHMIPIIIGDPVLCKKISDTLIDKYSIFIQHINYPTVARGQERLRITPTPGHTDSMIEQLVFALTETFKENGIL
jgi:5-aminolevulinate synthase